MGLRSRLRHLLRPSLGRPAPVQTRPLGPRLASAPPPATRWTLQDRELATGAPSLLHPELRAALSSSEPAALLRPLAPGLWLLPVLAEQTIERLLAELEAIDRAVAMGQLELDAPNSMHGHGVILEAAGLAPLAAQLSEVVQVFAPVFAELGPVELHDPHGFCIHYGSGADRDLGFHADDATLTLNLCLQSTAQGSAVVFEGARCIEHRQGPTLPEEVVVWEPRAGEALLHLGANRHRTEALRSGRRRSLVVWCRDRERVDLGECGPWCGVHSG